MFQGGYEQQGGGDQGGGYMNSPGFGSQGGTDERKTRSRAQNVMSCTVAQVFNATQTDDKFMVGNVELHQVTIVGLVRSVKESQTKLDYEIDDMSGPPLHVTQFVDNEDDAPEEERTIPMRENTYVRVYGNVRSFNQNRSVVAFRLMPIVDMNEITTHILEVIHSHLSLTKQMATAGVASSMDTSAAPSYTGDQGQSSFLKSLTNIQEQVLMLIRSCSDERGFSVQFITEKLRGIPQNSVREAAEFLISEGHIYSTIDDDHFKSADT